MDELNPSHEIDAAMREVVALRDQALGKMSVLSPARRAALDSSLTRQFPVEATLREVAAKRDNAIHPSWAQIPAGVASMLNRRVDDFGKTSGDRRATFWVARLRLPLAAALALCALLTVVVAKFASLEASRHDARKFPVVTPIDQIGGGSRIALVEPFTRKLALSSFNLNTNEPASLQLSFLSGNIRFTDADRTPLGIRLDLPVTVALTEEGFARTP